MPWRQVDAMNERFQFVRDARDYSVTDLSGPYPGGYLTSACT
jgi:hypothetical protein